MDVLTQFIFRLSCGLALCMAVTPSRIVSTGFYRNHLYVLLGLNVLATLVALGSPEQFKLWPPLSAAIVSYVGAVIWLYGWRRAGHISLMVVATVTLLGAWFAMTEPSESEATIRALRFLDPVTSGLVLGSTIAAMFLGHWYLNVPGMELQPIKRLVLIMAVAIALRAVVCGISLSLETSTDSLHPDSWIWLVLLRWLAGLLGALGVAWMSWQTLKIPNTQSATGILYVGVILTFLGELAGMLLSTDSVYPL